jgi:hypothetical protein
MESEYLCCIQCEQEFEFTPAEQDLYRQRGFDAPRRCPACRKHKSRTSHGDTERRREGKKREYRMKYEDG